MQPFGTFPPFYDASAALHTGFSRFPGGYGTQHNPHLDRLYGSRYSEASRFVTNRPASRDGSPFYRSTNVSFGVQPAQTQSWASQVPDSNMLWSRGIYSPCFRHDHHIIMKWSDPPFPVGDWEVDRRQMIEVQFDQFGVASTCRSTEGRVAVWRPERHQYTVEQAYAKLTSEIAALFYRLGLNPNDHSRRAGRGFEAPFSPWVNGNEYDYSMDGYRSVNPRSQGSSAYG